MQSASGRTRPVSGDAVEVATLGLDNRIALKKVKIARDLGAEVEITETWAWRSVSLPIPRLVTGDGEEVRVMDAANEKKQAPPGLQGARERGDRA